MRITTNLDTCWPRGVRLRYCVVRLATKIRSVDPAGYPCSVIGLGRADTIALAAASPIQTSAEALQLEYSPSDTNITLVVTAASSNGTTVRQWIQNLHISYEHAIF